LAWPGCSAYGLKNPLTLLQVGCVYIIFFENRYERDARTSNQHKLGLSGLLCKSRATSSL
jgi:hypothetical protein